MHRPLLALLLSVQGPAALAAPPRQEPTAPAAPNSAQEPKPAQLQAALAWAVDQPSALSRSAAAEELAAQDVETSVWLEAMAGFLPTDPGPLAGEGSTRVELLVDGRVELTELHWFVPEGVDPQRPSPLLVAMHGTGGHGGTSLPAFRSLATEWGAVLLAPSEAGPNGGFAATPRERLSVLAAIRWARRRWNVDENRIALTGYSRGAHLAWDLGLRYPSRFAALAPIAGGPRFELSRGAANLRYVENLRPLAVHALVGRQEQAGLLWNVLEIFRRLEKLDAPQAQLTVDENGGHGPDRSLVDYGAFLRGAVRNPRPDSVVRSFARPGEGRAAWIEVLSASKPTAEEFTPQIVASKQRRMDDDDLRLFLVDATEKRTGRLEVTRSKPGLYLAKSEGIESFRILLEARDLPAKGKVVVRFKSRRHSYKVETSSLVLLKEFVERFDRSFLPVAEVRVPPVR